MNSEARHQLISKYRGDFYQINRKLIEKVGFLEAAFFDVLVQYEDLMIRMGYIKDGEAFFMDSEKLTQYTKLTYKQQYRLFNILEESGLITFEVKGIPPRKWIKVNYEKLNKLIS